MKQTQNQIQASLVVFFVSKEEIENLTYFTLLFHFYLFPITNLG